MAMSTWRGAATSQSARAGVLLLAKKKGKGKGKGKDKSKKSGFEWASTFVSDT